MALGSAVCVDRVLRLSLFVLLSLPSEAMGAPTISSVSPTSAAVGASVTIIGTAFGSTKGTSTVKFNGITASTTSWSATSIVAVVPATATTGNVVVAVSGSPSNGSPFTVVAAPSISTVTPNAAARGTSVTIAGANFGASQGTSTVKFNGTTATVTSWSAGSIVVTVPSGATTGNVVVRASGVNSNGASFTVLPTPNIASLSPTSGAVGASITIAGSGFRATQGDGTITFNGTAATVTGWADTSIVATVPAGATTGNVVVRASGVNSNGRSFTVRLPPSISSLSPTTGAIGSEVTITGINFGSPQGTGTVGFNGVIGTPTTWSATSIRVPVPVGATSGNVVVRASGVDSNGRSFTVIPPPTIANVSPATGPPGASVTITGANFGATQDGSTVTFNSAAATATSWSATSIVVTVPAAATTGNIVVTVFGNASNNASFAVPTLTSIAFAPGAPALPVGATRRLIATGTYSDSSTGGLPSGAVWTSSAPNVATVGAATGFATGVAEGHTTIAVAVGSVSSSTPLTVSPSRFILTGSLNRARALPTATALASGKVLVVAGQDGDVVPTAELYDPASWRFVGTASPRITRHQFTATRLLDGRVLLVGGWSTAASAYTATAEIYDPSNGSFALTGSLSGPRGRDHTATLLGNGKVLVVGGYDQDLIPMASAELYDPASGTFSPGGNLLLPRAQHTATLLDDGSVLVAGGVDGGNILDTAETYNPATGLFTSAGALVTGRTSHTATRLSDGSVLMAGGYQGDLTPLAQAEIFDPVGKTFRATGSLVTARGSHTATLLNDSAVLLTGGTSTGHDWLGTAELYDAATGTFSLAGSLRTPRYNHVAALLTDGNVLIAGGSTAGGASTNAELYLATGVLPVPASLQITPGQATMVVGESRQFNVVDQLGRPRTDATWTVSDPNLATITTGSSASLGALATGQVTVTASIQGISAQAPVTISGVGSLPLGAARWSAPTSPGLSAKQIVVATRTNSGPDLYVIAGNSVRSVIKGLAADGRQLWEVAGPPVTSSAPDPFGGLVVSADNGCDGVNPQTILNLDGSGEQVWRIVGDLRCTSAVPQMAVRGNGTVAIVSPGNTPAFPPLMLVNGETGAFLSAPAIPTSTFMSSTGQPLAAYSRVGPPMVDSDGAVYLEYEIREVAYPPRVTWASLRLLKIALNGATTTTELSYTTADENLFPGRVIPDGAGGVIASWTASPSTAPSPSYPFKVARVTASGVATYDLPIQVAQLPAGNPTNPILVLGENGTAFASYDTTVVSFALASGALQWSSASPDKLSIIASTAGNGLVAKTGTPAASNTVIRFDSVGAPAVETWTGTAVNYFGGNLWAGVAAGSPATMHVAPPIDVNTVWSFADQGGTNRAVQNLVLSNQSEADPKQGAIRSRFVAIKALLDSGPPSVVQSCATWLASRSGGVSASSYIQTLFLDQNRFGHATYNIKRIAASVGERNLDQTPVGMLPNWSLAVNADGAFFSAGSGRNRYFVGLRRYVGGTPRAQAEILVHELAHLLHATDFRPDVADERAADINDALIDLFCSPLIELSQ